MCAQLLSCPTLCDPMDCSPPGSSVLGDAPGQNAGMGCHALLQGIFPTQGSKPGLPHCRWILYHLSHQGSPKGRYEKCESESHSVMSNSLQPRGLYSPWNSPGWNTGVGSLSLLQQIFPSQELNRGLLYCRWILYQLSYEGSPLGRYMYFSIL